ncbi:sugar ABC transporter substrate-binding protein [Streptomyces abyssalis]|uniref:Sugar ABC transporter substrate-binding protein n=1 Tax=Streptomyces abyssalis TaxID=933944 RepID=A0A1E7JS46_9ACTN|nr:extracellular solute-binding protein [Streptomyces abyssalis]OEU91722.1 sugar ABC transporter substrate-binding protein [Streptomyces abyssalis]OEU94141.1 sugar ABC transporter substrate-binding protein [Streptomyces abyssalis]OEV08306.1 sugar ABC transporter substrate-binding protein [Streptomyces nanshensis]
MRRKTGAVLLALALTGVSTGCARTAPDSTAAASARGPITVWLSNNAQEVAWGEKMVAEWNAKHPRQRITAQQIPAGKTSEEALSASIVAGNSACLVFNTSPASVPQFQKQAGLVPLDDFPGGEKYVDGRTGERAAQYRSEDGKFYQLPWKSNPVMILYNKKIFEKAGLDPEKPKLSTHEEFLDSSRKIVRSGAAKSAIWPAPSSEFFQSWFDFYPSFIAESGGKQLVKDGKPQFDTPAGRRVVNFWRTVYREKLAQQELFPGDSMAAGKAAMTIAGPWAVAAYKDTIDWGVVPVPTSKGLPASETHTFSDEKSVSMFSACRNRATAWDVLKFATSKKQDRAFLDATGQMPMRPDLLGTYEQWFEKNPAYREFGDQADRIVEVPSVAGSVDVWQALRDRWTASVVFGRERPEPALRDASREISELLDEY